MTAIDNALSGFIEEKETATRYRTNETRIATFRLVTPLDARQRVTLTDKDISFLHLNKVSKERDFLPTPYTRKDAETLFIIFVAV
jgi:hypothetical protein